MPRLPPLIEGIVDACVDAAIVVDPELQLLHFNRAFTLLTGLRPRELAGKARAGVCHELIGLESCKGSDGCLSSQAIRTKRPVRMDEVHTSTLDMRLIVTAIPLLDEGGRIVAVMETYRDVTAESRMQSRYKELLEVERRQNEELQEEVRVRTIELQHAVVELEAKNATLEQLAIRDGLTGLYNHRFFQQRLREEVARSQRAGATLSLILADVDHFKRVNDRCGHPTGDAVLRFAAAVLDAGTDSIPPARRSDVVARYGGEEFALVLVDTPKEGAAIRAERLREAFRDATPPNGAPHITLSFGIASFPGDAEDPADLIQRADEALLQAKRDGRDRVVLWASEARSKASLAVNRTDVQATLAATLRADKLISLVSLNLIDLGRLQRHHGNTGARAAHEAFAKVVTREAHKVIVDERLLALVGSEPDRIEVFLRHPKQGRMGPSYLENVSERLAARVEAGLRDELAGIGLARVVSGHATHLYSAGSTVERQVDRLSGYALDQARVASDLRRAQDKLAIQRVILDESIYSCVQPIFDANGKTIGVEALARGPEGSDLESPISLLDLAEDVDLVLELDRCMLRAGFATFARCKEESLLFLNVLPSTICNEGFVTSELPALAAAASIPPNRIVLELSERQSPDQERFSAALATLREQGFVLGLDDLGTQNANLAEIAAFRPEWLKLDRSLVRGLHRDPVKSDLIAAVVDFAHRQASKVIAEGIELVEELEALKRLKVDGFQGFLLGRPKLPE